MVICCDIRCDFSLLSTFWNSDINHRLKGEAGRSHKTTAKLKGLKATSSIHFFNFSFFNQFLVVALHPEVREEAAILHGLSLIFSFFLGADQRDFIQDLRLHHFHN